MEYKPVQKKNSSWTPTPVQKKGKSPGKMGHFSIQPKSNPSSAPSPEIGEYSRASADRLAANVMRGIQAKELELAEGSTLRLRSGSTLQRKSESPWVSTFDAPPPIPQSPASQLKGAFAPVSENPIQRQCADCAKEEKEQSGEAGKDLEEIGIQTKLTLRLRSGSTIGAPGDTYEQEADRVASQVMSMSAPPDSSASVQRQLDTNHPHHPHQIWQRAQSIKPVVHRQVDPRVQMRQMIQRAHQIDGNQASGDLESRLNASKGGGSPLSEGVRGFMEPRFGADFSGVRVHTGGEAVQMNRELGAQAFTHGSDVYFGEGTSPGTNELTAHELTHFVQQTGVVQPVQAKLEVVQLQNDGSGTHGTEEAGTGDRLKKQFWYRVADTAESLGMTNAARHMRHYLNNTGTELNVSVDQMLRDLLGLQARFQTEIETATAEANSQIAAGDPTQHLRFALEGQRRNYYARKSESEDWFFALGGFTYWYTAEIEVIPSSTSGANTTVNMIIELHVFDRYNWDKGKSVTIGPFVVTDESLGQLHRTGLAQEYEVNGISSPVTTSWTYSGSSSTPTLPTAGSHDGERTDPGRDRASDRRQDRELRDTPDRTRR
ncbi:eCIS core domain-containing protein [Coleofasciculus sp.]|uniref:eCIS core domain-containing protein n=1 Tax=Coleofasciculus sp. TaxID=3100458 RepID=UPI003A2C39BF